MTEQEPKKETSAAAAAAAAGGVEATGKDPKAAKAEPSTAAADAAALASGEEAPTETPAAKETAPSTTTPDEPPAPVEETSETAEKTEETELATTDETETVVSASALSVSVDSAIEIPEWLKGEEIVGVDDVGDFMSTPRLSIIQAMSEEERKEMFGEGSSVIMPDGIMVAKKGEEFSGIPLIFWVTYEEWTDILDSTTDMVIEVTQDSNSELARKARSKATRQEVYGPDGQFIRKFVESLNFIVMVDSGPAKGELVTMSFAVGEHHTGTKLCGLFKRRPISLFANRVAFKVALRNRNNLKWYGYDFGNPAEADGGAVVQDQERYFKLKAIHEGLKGLVERGEVLVDHTGDDAVVVSGDVVEDGETVHPDI